MSNACSLSAFYRHQGLNSDVQRPECLTHAFCTLSNFIFVLYIYWDFGTARSIPILYGPGRNDFIMARTQCHRPLASTDSFMFDTTSGAGVVFRARVGAILRLNLDLHG